MSDKQLNSIRNEVKSYISKSGWTLTNIVEVLNERYPEQPATTQNISNKLSRGTIKYSEVKELVAIIGFEINWMLK